jgi:hypothetical protein
MNPFKTLAMVGLVGVGMVIHCFAQNVYPPFPDELVNKYDIIATAKVTETAGPLSGSTFWQNNQIGIEVALVRLLPKKVLKGKLRRDPIVIQNIGSETIELEKNKEYLLFLRQTDCYYQPANIFPIKNGKVDWYKDNQKKLPAPRWENMPIEQAIKSIEVIVNDAGASSHSPTPR